MKHKVTSSFVILDRWTHPLRGQHLDGCGNVDLLSGSLTAFFASRVCPAPAIRTGLAWTLEQAHAGGAVIGGFHSPLEQSVLNLLLEARSPVVAVLARAIASARLPIVWRAAIQRGHMAVVSQAASRRRLDHDSSISRNELVSRLADRIVVAHVSESGSLAGQMREWRRQGKCIRLLSNELVGHGLNDMALQQSKQIVPEPSTIVSEQK